MITNHSTSYAVVVVAHRQYETLALCLEGLRKSTTAPGDVIFVDNGSNGELSTWAMETFSDITVVTLKENRLFCGGYNAGLRLAMERGYTYALIVNADTEVVDPTFILRLIDVIERWPRAAFVGPKVFLRQQGEVQNTIFRFPTIIQFVMVWLPFRMFPSVLQPNLDRERAVHTLNGVCVLCRLSALREIGLMDETFGAYVEDTDWSWRAHRRGWVSVYAPVVSIIHHEEPTGYEHHAFKTFLLKRNTVRWYLKSDQQISARAYAVAALGLARLRTLMAGAAEKPTYRDFAERLSRVYARLIAGDELGPWYGAPFDTPGYCETVLATDPDAAE